MERRPDTMLFILETARLRLPLAPANRVSRRALKGVISGARGTVLNWMLHWKSVKDFAMPGIADGTPLDAVTGTAKDGIWMLDFNEERTLRGRIETPYQNVDRVYPWVDAGCSLGTCPRWICTQGHASPALLLGRPEGLVTNRRIFARHAPNDTCVIAPLKTGKFSGFANYSDGREVYGYVIFTTSNGITGNRTKKSRHEVIGSEHDSVRCRIAGGTHRYSYKVPGSWGMGRLWDHADTTEVGNAQRQ
jgi:hypothetical protein